MGLGQEKQEGHYIDISLSLPNAHPEGVPLLPLFHIKDEEKDACLSPWIRAHLQVAAATGPTRHSRRHPAGAGSPTAHHSSRPLAILPHASSQPLPGRTQQSRAAVPLGTAMPSTACSNLRGKQRRWQSPTEILPV